MTQWTALSDPIRGEINAHFDHDQRHVQITYINAQGLELTDQVDIDDYDEYVPVNLGDAPYEVQISHDEGELLLTIYPMVEFTESGNIEIDTEQGVSISFTESGTIRSHYTEGGK